MFRCVRCYPGTRPSPGSVCPAVHIWACSWLGRNCWSFLTQSPGERGRSYTQAAARTPAGKTSHVRTLHHFYHFLRLFNTIIHWRHWNHVLIELYQIRDTEKDRQTERERDRQTERERDRQDRERQTVREREERARQSESETVRERGRERDRQRERERERQTGRERETETDRRTVRETDRGYLAPLWLLNYVYSSQVLSSFHFLWYLTTEFFRLVVWGGGGGGGVVPVFVTSTVALMVKGLNELWNK